MAVHMKYLSILFCSLLLLLHCKDRKRSLCCKHASHACAEDAEATTELLFIKILLDGIVILKFNKQNMKVSHWWWKGKLNLSLPVKSINPLKPHLQLRVKRSLSVLHKSRGPLHHSTWEPFNESWIKLSVAASAHKSFLSATSWWNLSLFVSTSLTENKHPNLSVTH